jgi:hypothetical protein
MKSKQRKSKSFSQPIMGTVPFVDFKSKSKSEDITQEIKGGGDEVNKKFRNPGDAPAGQVIVNGGGFVFDNININLIFWGQEWSSVNPPVLSNSIVTGVANIVSGFFLDGLKQYGFKNAFINKVKIINIDPPNPFNVNDIKNFVYGLIDDETLQEPDEETFFRNIHVVFTPSNINFTQPNPRTPINGFHSFFSWNDYDLGDIDNSNTYFAWVQNVGNLNSITQVFSHELAEAITDPEGNGIQIAPTNPINWNEIGDICSSTGITNGVSVQSYWSKIDDACIIPIYQPPAPPPAPPMPAPNTQLEIIGVRLSHSTAGGGGGFNYIGYVRAIDDRGKYWVLHRYDVVSLIEEHGNTFIVKGRDGSQSSVIVERYYIKTTPDNSTEDNLLSLPLF